MDLDTDIDFRAFDEKVKNIGFPVLRASSQYDNSLEKYDYAHKSFSIDRAFPVLDCL